MLSLPHPLFREKPGFWRQGHLLCHTMFSCVAGGSHHRAQNSATGPGKEAEPGQPGKDKLITKITTEKKVFEEHREFSPASRKRKQVYPEQGYPGKGLSDHPNDLVESSAQLKDKATEIFQIEAEWKK